MEERELKDGQKREEKKRKRDIEKIERYTASTVTVAEGSYGWFIYYEIMTQRILTLQRALINFSRLSITSFTIQISSSH